LRDQDMHEQTTTNDLFDPRDEGGKFFKNKKKHVFLWS